MVPNLRDLGYHGSLWASMGYYGVAWVNKTFRTQCIARFFAPSGTVSGKAFGGAHSTPGIRRFYGAAVLDSGRWRPAANAALGGGPGEPPLPFRQGLENERKRKNARRPVSRVLYPPRRATTIHLGRPLPDASRDLPGRRRGNPPAGASAGMPPLFGLAPGGVYRAAPVAGSAVRSYRTLSPLPRAEARLAVCFLWHFPWGRPRRPLAGTVSPWSPDFPPRRRRNAAEAAVRPSGTRQGKPPAARVKR